MAILTAAACSLASTAPALPYEATRPDATRTAAHTPIRPATATSAPSSLPTRVPDELVWFAPNMGSVDYTGLFSDPGAWEETRASVDVFKFYMQNVLDFECEICGGNILSAFAEVNAFRKLAAWNMAAAIEVGAVKEWGCTGDEGFRNTDAAIRNIQRSGGQVSFLAMDEPLLGGQHVINGLTCGLDPEAIARATANFVEQVGEAYPAIQVGDIEPYPHFSASELEEWIGMLDGQGVSLAFFHLDVDIERVRVEGQDVLAGLRRLQAFSEERGIPFGVIFISNWTQAGSNQAYYLSTMKWIETVKSAIGRPSHVIFQSWQGPAPSGAHEIPSNLPLGEGDDFSHTRLILDGLRLLEE